MSLTKRDLRMQFQSWYSFNDPSLLEEATTHKSYQQTKSNAKCYDRLEFLGDAVLKAIQAKLVFELYPDCDEGHLSKTRSHLENNHQLALWCRHLGLDSRIKVGLSIERGSMAWINICSQVFEAYLGAVWKDCGFDFDTVFNLYQSWDLPVRQQVIANYKSMLQEYIQKEYVCCKGEGDFDFDDSCLIYEILQKSGPCHMPTFTVQCTIKIPDSYHSHQSEQSQGKLSGKAAVKVTGVCKAEDVKVKSFREVSVVARGSSRKKAEMEAAQQMLTELGVDSVVVEEWENFY